MSCASADDTRIRMTKILDDTVRSVQRLKELLLEEREALEQRDTVSLSTTANSKLVLVREIADLNQTRGKVSAQAGFGHEPEYIDDLADWCDDKSTITTLWQELKSIASECDFINKTNGAIIHQRCRHIRDGLSVLRGSDHDTDTYAPTGSATNGNSGRPIIEA